MRTERSEEELYQRKLIKAVLRSLNRSNLFLRVTYIQPASLLKPWLEFVDQAVFILFWHKRLSDFVIPLIQSPTPFVASKLYQKETLSLFNVPRETINFVYK